MASACSDAELVQSPEDLEVLRRLRTPDHKLTLLGNGIDLERFDPGTVTAEDADAARTELGATAPGEVVIGLVGRLVREKGYPEVFRAANALRERFPQARVAVIGADEPDKADALTPEDRSDAERAGIRFLRGRDDVVRLYAGMDIYVLASHREGFPRSPMEAAAMGPRVVATDIRASRQVVDDGRTGLLVNPRDPLALTDALVALIGDLDRRRRMGEAGRAKAEASFDQRSCIATTLNTYRRLLARAGIESPTAPVP